MYAIDLEIAFEYGGNKCHTHAIDLERAWDTFDEMFFMSGIELSTISSFSSQTMGVALLIHLLPLDTACLFHLKAVTKCFLLYV